MDETGVRDVVLARAVEQVDHEGTLVSLRARSNASREARSRAADDRERFLEARARQVIAPLVTEHRGFARARAIAGRMALPGWIAFASAFVAGFAVDHFGAGKHVDVLSFPLLGLLVWNLCAYAFFFFAQLGRLGSSSIRSSQSGWLARVMTWLASPDRPWTRLRKAEEVGLLANSLERFLRDWARAGAPLHLARARLAVHCGAAGLALGIVSGMYVRGLVLEYRASWESTFLGPEGVHALLAFFLGPAAALLGTHVPDAQALAGMERPQGDANAAIWIHLYSVTALVVIVIPRIALAWFARRRARELARHLPIEWERDPYFLRLFALDRGAGSRAELLPYSYRPSARASDELSGLLLDLFGNRTQIELRPAIEYGAEPPPIARVEGDDALSTCRVALFNLAQSPEQEVHGEFLHALQRGIEADGELARLLVVVDESRYAERLGGDEEANERLDQRRRSWQRLFRDGGIEALFLPLDGALSPDALAKAQEALWPSRLAGATP